MNEAKKPEQESWKDVLFMATVAVFMITLLYFGSRMMFNLAAPFDAVKYGAFTAARLAEMQKRLDTMEGRLERLERAKDAGQAVEARQKGK